MKSGVKRGASPIVTALLDNPDLISDVVNNPNARLLSALSGAWEWGAYKDKSANEPADKLDFPKYKDDAQATPYLSVTNLVNSKAPADDKKERFTNYQGIAGFVLAKANPYEAMGEALKRLGIVAQGDKGYESRVGITLSKRNVVDIGAGTPKPLAASTPGAAQTDSAEIPARVLDDLIDRARAELDLLEGDYSMWFSDVPPAPDLALSPPAIYLAAKDVSNIDAVPHRLGVCRTVEADRKVFDPRFDAGAYVQRFLKMDMNFIDNADDSHRTDVVVRVLKEPEHGTLELLYPEAKADDFERFRYVFESGPSEDNSGNERYRGFDHFIIEVSAGGITVEIHYTMSVVDNFRGDHGGVVSGCEDPEWFISDATGTAGTFATLLASATQTLTGFADLSGSSVGETIGSGASARIALDTTASGHGWFIDYTPYLNEEFLPTSNPNEWIAKPGSEAEGKMDMLTVLLHEYGHALGLDHTADAHDFMAATLQPGVRRTLTVDEQLELMRLAGIFVTPGSPSEPYGPTDPGAPLPFTRVIATRSARRAAGFDSLVPQFDTAANPKLTNSDFASAEAWSTTGDVRFENGTATLAEGSATQTRLNQVFVVNEGDRFLSFTVANAALGDQAYGPDDAFEVALLDANTGLSLLGGTGLTKSDAALNRQADGSEFKASGISSVANADGSRTYLVDLAGVAAGTVVNLSFDLIGFGKGLEAQNSRLTIRDLRLGVPQTTDDAVVAAEDAPLVIDALANDLNARQPGFVPVVATGPAHGQVSINADGSFAYTPEKDWFGEDRFTYALKEVPLRDKLSVAPKEAPLGGGRVDSNLATVVLTVTPVNDVPVAPTRTVTLDEDGSATVDLLASASDSASPSHRRKRPAGEGASTLGAPVFGGSSLHTLDSGVSPE